MSSPGIFMKQLAVIDAGIMHYGDTWRLQKGIVARKRSGDRRDYLILVEHPNIFTIGRRGSEDNILADKDRLKEESLEVLHVDRGGDITFHGPGQIVAYPLFDLRNHVRDVRLFIRNLENVISLVIKDYGVEAESGKGHTGVWVAGAKLGFIGISITGWITYHGMSLNVNTNLEYFAMIRPCGIEGITATSLAKILGRHIDTDFLKKSIVAKFCEVFRFEHESNSENAFMALAGSAGYRS